MSNLMTIGRADTIDLPTHDLAKVPMRIDTGAKTSAIWASDVRERNGQLHFKLFGKGNKFYSGEVITTSVYELRAVSTSTGHVQQRYAVKLPIVIKGRKIRATFTLANRSTQVYPVLIGRNVLRGKFVVDVTQGQPLLAQEKQRSRQIRQKFAATERRKI